MAEAPDSERPHDNIERRVDAVERRRSATSAWLRVNAVAVVTLIIAMLGAIVTGATVASNVLSQQHAEGEAITGLRNELHGLDVRLHEMQSDVAVLRDRSSRSSPDRH